MKKYILKKWYPGLPKDWEVGMELEVNIKNYGHYGPCDEKYHKYFISCSSIENNPEFWEKAEELCVPVGSKFKHCDKDDYTIYTVDKVVGDRVHISWISRRGVAENITYYIKIFNEYFKNGTWILVEDKKPIFISEDNIEMFEGMAYWYIDRYYRLFDVTEVYKNLKLSTDIIRFSTKEAAEKYIELHKPKYSEIEMKDARFAAFKDGLCFLNNIKKLSI